MSMDKVPGSANPPSPLENKAFNSMAGVNTTKPKMDYAMGNPGQATSPVENQVNPSANTQPMEIGPGVSGSINPGVDYQ